MKDIIVLKFGGTSVSSLTRWKNISDIVKERSREAKKTIVVCSAIRGISDRLEKLIDNILRVDFKIGLDEIKTIHYNLAKELGIDGKEILKDEFDYLERILFGASYLEEKGPKITAKVMSFGEILLTHLGTEFLKKEGHKAGWFDAKEALTTKDPENLPDWKRFLQASCDFHPEKDLIQMISSLKENVIITQGFFGKTQNGDTALLGRGGSDTSASYFASKLNAQRLEIWTDVPGMYTTNPSMVSQARLLKKLTYIEAQEMASTGAKVLHPRCIGPVMKYNIPLQILCTQRPEISGTLVSGNNEESGTGVKSISVRKNIALISVENVMMWQEVGFLAKLFSKFQHHGISIDLLSTSESTVTVSIDPSPHDDFEEQLKNLMVDLGNLGKATIISDCVAITLVGNNIRSILYKLSPVLKIFEEKKIHLLSQAANDLNLSFVMDQEGHEKLVSEIHNQLFDTSYENETFGPTWLEQFGETKGKGLKTKNWWKKNKQKIIKIANKEKSAFVYFGPKIKEQAEKIKSLKSLDKIFYSIKANSHPEVLKLIEKLGIGLECVSLNELKFVEKLFPKIKNEKVLFTPNFSSKEEYQYALKKKYFVTVDNGYSLREWTSLFKNQKILLRIDPGKGKGHHAHVQTAGNQSKFGITPDQAIELLPLIKKNKISVVGLHAHAGSGITTPQHWKEVALFLCNLAEKFSGVKYLNLGGGLSVPMRPNENEFNLGQLDEELIRVKELYPQYQFLMEPGRFFVAQAGVLVSQVTQIKRKGDINYLGINTGMNSLIRPALYGSYHHILNLTKLDSPHTLNANVVGPICETGDILGISRPFPKTQEGDIILIDCAGAYGRVMSSEYNKRLPAKEIFLKI
jgi:diaminopimelate decarboxylase/aspartate kinase